MANLTRLAIDHGDRLQSTGYALETLANLLGCDGSEHHLTEDDLNGLTHAVRALAGYTLTAGLDIYKAAELASATEQQGGAA